MSQSGKGWIRHGEIFSLIFSLIMTNTNMAWPGGCQRGNFYETQFKGHNNFYKGSSLGFYHLKYSLWSIKHIIFVNLLFINCQRHWLKTSWEMGGTQASTKQEDKSEWRPILQALPSLLNAFMSRPHLCLDINLNTAENELESKNPTLFQVRCLVHSVNIESKLFSVLCNTFSILIW